jgi:hypothetical protein
MVICWRLEVLSLPQIWPQTARFEDLGDVPQTTQVYFVRPT